MTDLSITRDRFGRPLLYPPTGPSRTAYTRPSTMAKWVDDKGGLINWTASMAMVGMMKSKPLQARVSAIVARSQDPYRENKIAMRELVQSATQIAQASGRADLGTAIHEFVELLDAGTLQWEFVPEALKGPLEAYQEAAQVLQAIDSEVFVAVDETVNGKKIKAAGSLDKLCHHPDFGVVVADVKTGADEPKYPLGCTTQVAIYSRGLRYKDDQLHVDSFEGGEKSPDNPSTRKVLHPKLNKKWGLMIHCPLEKVGGKYRCDFYPLDLQKGWGNVELGHTVQAARRMKALEAL